MPTAVVTDSTSDIPYELAEQHNIRIVPNILVIDGQRILDDQNFSRQEFYKRLPGLRTFPTTGTASSGAYQQIYDELLQSGYDRILSIHTSSLLSGICNAANAAAEAFAGHVRVIDSHSVTLGLGFQVLLAAEAASANLSFEAIQALVEHVRPHVRVVAMLDTLEYIRRSGRVSWARASLGALLNIKPFVEVKDGLVNRLGEVRTRSRGIARLLEMMRALDGLEALAILHTNAEEEAVHLLESLSPRLSKPPLVVNITTVIGAHVGPGGLGFAAVVG